MSTIPLFYHKLPDYVYNNEKRLIPEDELPRYSTHVGQVIMSTTLSTAAAVAAVYGGTWEAWGAGRVPVGVDPNDSDFNAPNKTGGAKTVTLTTEQIPAHQHKMHLCYYNYAGGSTAPKNGKIMQASDNSYWNYNAGHTENAGGGSAHNNMQPYRTVYMWRRTA